MNISVIRIHKLVYNYSKHFTMSDHLKAFTKYNLTRVLSVLYIVTGYLDIF